MGAQDFHRPGQLMTAADFQALFRAICVQDNVIAGAFGKLPLAAHRRKEPIAARLNLPLVRGVHEHQPLGLRGTGFDRNGLILNDHDVADLEGDAPADALASRRVL